MSRKLPSPPAKIRQLKPKGIAAAIALLLCAAAGIGYWWNTPPMRAYRHFRAGQKFEEKGISAAAMMEYRSAVDIEKTYSAPYLAMAHVEQNNGNLGTAADLMGTVLYYHPHYPHIQCRRAQLYGIANRFEMAFTIAKDAIEIEPDCAAAHNDMGMLYSICGNDADAALELGKAHQLAPTDEALTLDYARVLAKTGKADEAFAIVDTVLTKTRLFKTQANYLEGWILSEYGRSGVKDSHSLADGIQHLGLALVDTPSHTASLQQLGIIYIRTGNLPGAQTALEKAFKAGPATLEMLDAMVDVYRKQNNPNLDSAIAVDTRYREVFLPLKLARLEYVKRPLNLDNNMVLAKLELEVGNKLDAFSLVKLVHDRAPERKDAAQLYEEMIHPKPN